MRANAGANSSSPGAVSVQQELPLAEPGINLVRSARRRTLAIHVDARGRVEVRAPLWVAHAEVRAFVERHYDWIRRKVDAAKESPAWYPRWQAGGDWFWQGERVLLAVGQPGRSHLEHGQLYLPLAADAPAAEWRRALFRWHRTHAQTLLQERVHALFDQHGGDHRLHAVKFRWMRVTWGTCGGRRAADGRRDVVLRLNPWLAALPPALMDSVLLHELAHIEHMNHSAAFYRRLAKLDPQWREHDALLTAWARRLFPVTDESEHG